MNRKKLISQLFIPEFFSSKYFLLNIFDVFKNVHIYIANLILYLSKVFFMNCVLVSKAHCIKNFLFSIKLNNKPFFLYMFFVSIFVLEYKVTSKIDLPVSICKLIYLRLETFCKKYTQLKMQIRNYFFNLVFIYTQP